MISKAQLKATLPKVINLKKQSLRGQSFENQKLIKADFSYSDLRDTNFSGAVLRGADFSNTLASGADFSNADIRGAKFTQADLREANFHNSNAGLRPVAGIILMIIAILLSAVSGIAHIHASTIPFSDVPLITSLDISTYQRFAFIPRTVALTTILIFIAISIWNGFAKSLATVAVSVTSLFLISTILAISIDPGTAWNIVDYSLWCVAGSLAWAVFGTITLTINATILGILNSIYLVFLASIAATLSAGTIGLGFLEPVSPSFAARAQVLTIAISLNIVSNFLAWKAIKGKRNFLWLRKLALFLITQMGSTDFSKSDLSAARLTGTQLKAVVFGNRTILDKTCFQQAKYLEFARVAGTYLEESWVKKLVVDKKYDPKSCDHFRSLDLSGANLSKADLTGIDFSGADLSKANLQDANLSKAKLVSTNLDGTDLTGAILTGATIENWSITASTTLNGVQCKYVFMKAINIDAADQNPLRKPDSYSEEFKDGEFADFIMPLCTTLDLYHREDIDPRAIAISYKQLEETYPEANLDIVAIEKRGKRKDNILLKVEAARNANLSELSDEYQRLYQQVKSLSKTDILFLLSENSRQINFLTQQIESLVGNLSRNQHLQRPETSSIDDFILLTFTDGDFKQGFTVTALIWSNQRSLPATVSAKLPPAPELQTTYQTWKTLYCALANCKSRVILDENESLTNISRQELDNWSLQLEKQFNSWLSSESFLQLANKLRDSFHVEHEFPIVIQTNHGDLCRLPWHLWNFSKSYFRTAVAFGHLGAEPVETLSAQSACRRVLAVLGNSQGIDVKVDHQMLTQLACQSADIKFLVEPQRHEFYDVLGEVEGWDILYFAGHSQSLRNNQSGILQLNSTDQLNLEELHYAISKAVRKRLQLVMINACDGLGLAHKLEELSVPHVIVMKEPVPDEVAQAFLKSFLRAFSQGESLYASFREARRSLEILQDRYPCASWLPVLFKNSAEAPITWS